MKNVLDLILRVVHATLPASAPGKEIIVNEKLIGLGVQNYFSLCKTADNRKYMDEMAAKNTS
jgi:hypothetical protein